MAPIRAPLPPQTDDFLQRLYEANRVRIYQEPERPGQSNFYSAIPMTNAGTVGSAFLKVVRPNGSEAQNAQPEYTYRPTIDTKNATPLNPRVATRASLGESTSIRSMSDQERARVIDTIIAEAATGGYDAMLAVANVINNRGLARDANPYQVVSQPGQFQGFENPGSKSKAAMKDEGLRALAASALDAALSGETPDPTNGATFFHSGKAPYWADDMTQTTRVGGLKFYAAGDAAASLSTLAVSSPDRVKDDRIAPDLSSRTLVGYSRNPPGYSVASGRGIENADPRLQATVRAAAEAFIAANPGYRVEAFSGKEKRGTGTKNHIAGHAIDVLIYDPSGNMLPNSPKRARDMGVPLAPAFRAYEQFAQAARQYQLQNYPEMGTLRWGGYFQQGTTFDLMHLDITDRTTALGDWKGGLNAQGRRMLPGAESVGMGDYATQYAANWSPFGSVNTPTETASLSPGLLGGGVTPGQLPSEQSTFGNDPFAAANLRGPNDLGGPPAAAPRVPMPPLMTGTNFHGGKFADDMGYPTLAESDRRMEAFRESERAKAFSAMPPANLAPPRSRAAIEAEIAALKEDVAKTATNYLDKGVNVAEATSALERIGVLDRQQAARPSIPSPVSISDRTRAAARQPSFRPDLTGSGSFAPSTFAASGMRDQFPRDALYDAGPLSPSATLRAAAPGSAAAHAGSSIYPRLDLSGSAQGFSPPAGFASANGSVQLDPVAERMAGAFAAAGGQAPASAALIDAARRVSASAPIIPGPATGSTSRPASATATALRDPSILFTPQGRGATLSAERPTSASATAARNPAADLSLSGFAASGATGRPAATASATAREPLRVTQGILSGESRGSTLPPLSAKANASLPTLFGSAMPSLTGQGSAGSSPSIYADFGSVPAAVSIGSGMADPGRSFSPMASGFASPFNDLSESVLGSPAERLNTYFAAPPSSATATAARPVAKPAAHPASTVSQAGPRTITPQDNARELAMQTARLDLNLLPVSVPTPVATTPFSLPKNTPYNTALGPVPGSFTPRNYGPVFGGKEADDNIGPPLTAQRPTIPAPSIPSPAPAPPSLPQVAAPAAPEVPTFTAPINDPAAVRRATEQAVRAGIGSLMFAGPVQRAIQIGAIGGPGAFWKAFDAVPSSPSLRNQASWAASQLFGPTPNVPAPSSVRPPMSAPIVVVSASRADPRSSPTGTYPASAYSASLSRQAGNIGNVTGNAGRGYR